MQDADMDLVYKADLPISHIAGLRSVFDAGYNEALNISVTTTTVDQSLVAQEPTVEVVVTTV